MGGRFAHQRAAGARVLGCAVARVAGAGGLRRGPRRWDARIGLRQQEHFAFPPDGMRRR